jgi:hypothetical protein
MTHGEDYVVRMFETAMRAWLEPRVRMIPCFAILMDQMTVSAYKRALQSHLDGARVLLDDVFHRHLHGVRRQLLRRRVRRRRIPRTR